MRNLLNTFRRDDGGATSIEYALIAAFIGIAIITVVQNVGIELTGIFSDVQSGLKKRPSA
ncbi:MAG: Flp family type IVb pilin [Hyphomicrobiaceae bacterium]